ncbi:leucyl aminopeptidase [Candidatus Nitrosotenuis chungbukensis]|uniref:leucyl aminopeptidase n=1 Tax=Candidatus Nitrosotenuis chungbukensis TaxID=1353246 RepID=UPI0005B2BD9E|nr:leucyl aminopeptidase [Candidatus Nitrosotenuis chungbukensis]
MIISSESAQPIKKKTRALCFFVAEKSEPFGLPKMDAKILAAIKQSVKETKGKRASLDVIHSHGLIPAERIVIAGLGPVHKITHETVRISSGKIAKKIRDLEISEFSIVLPDKFPLKADVAANAIVEGVSLSQYSFDKYKKEKNPKLQRVTILVSDKTKISDQISKAMTVSDGVNFARSIANLPPNECAPVHMAGFAKSLAAKNKLKCTILSKNELRQKGFGGITAVGQGSKNEPKLIILEYNGKKDDRPTVLVGKAVTFDTGGISIKPADKMDEMKFDKCGGCTVLGIMKAVSELKLPVNVVGIIPSVENMPGGESYRPGDIIRMYGGSTAEILNTDAEGRLILSDALSYGVKTYKPKAVLDFATLTGACIVALGPNVAGLVSNNNGIASKIRKSSEKTGEEVWQLPLNDDYTDMIKSDYADIKNVGIGRAAGAITAAAFLANAVGTTPWAHFDIAGTAWIQTGTKEKSYNPKGATGFGVRLGVDYLASSP